MRKKDIDAFERWLMGADEEGVEGEEGERHRHRHGHGYDNGDGDGEMRTKKLCILTGPTGCGKVWIVIDSLSF